MRRILKEPPDPYERLVQLVVLIGVIIVLVSLLTSCSSHREPYPWNMPKSWEYNRHFEGLQSVYDAYKSLMAPKGMLWDHLTQSYQQDLGSLDDGFKLPSVTSHENF